MKPPHNTALASIVVSTAHATEETTSSSDDSLARKARSYLMPEVTVDSSVCQQGELNAHIVDLPEGIQNREIFQGKAVFFADQRKPRQIFVDDGI